MPPLLVLGTRNRKKQVELEDLLHPHGIALATLAEFQHAIEIEEDGRTFLENATKKAAVQARLLGHWVLGEDSGLVVPALDGQPGIFSARYSGPAATDASNNARLLDELCGVPLERRAAYYVCTAVLADPQGQPQASTEGRCYGRIRNEPFGSGGFGYDPLFEVVEYHRTYGELSNEVKACLSHRGRAMRQLLPELLRCLTSQAE